MTRSILSIAAMLFTLVASLPTVAQENSHDRIATLEAQVKTLKAQIERLSTMNETLESQLAGIRGILGVTKASQHTADATSTDQEISHCMVRLSEIRSVKDRLLSLGYREGHPDVINITAQETTVSEECDTLINTQGR